MELKPQSLMVAIQCVAAQVRLLDGQLERDESSNAEELEQLLVSFDIAAADLRAAYEEALQRYDGLPSYEALMARVRS
jgi:hypothetical protein